MKWRREPPTRTEVAGEAYFWFNGGNFNRPIIVKINCGSRLTADSETAKYEAELNSKFSGHYDYIWKPDWPTGQWAGPIPQPTE